MTLRIMVKDSQGKMCKALTQEQFSKVHDYIVDVMNAGRAPKDDVIRAKLSAAGMPMDFTQGAEPVPQRRGRRA